ncbi:cysteine-tryptophan domain-containing zinc finger protein 7-like isoform X2 [Corylus avellana]|uniref:cysteine-tryptophan domain-containing zinc finger protein 7-like isoform X2 n=1 Tax=Corylus avellana TaxID=13451 RepID=UPI00286A9B7A|nr:cysteine-tryptophan domain-containing zinc finger protein 7-like isoform X2 [Corylus avellana]XP_059435061.1 cysteine-tryptophan domain-containing zinc finger protein 7-like isoform X2 [Corylus avellana]
MVGMEENAELEEGEASYYGDDEDKIIDPDISLSYIDEKIRSVLGHFQKDFEGGVSAENLGAKFGGYGSFLPTYERSPSIWSRPKTPPKNYNAPRSPNNIPIEGASQNFKAPSNKAPSLRLGTATCSAHPLHNSRVASADVSIKQNQVAEKSPLKDESSNRSGNLTDQRTLKVRIKVGCDNLARKNAAIYSGLGLDDSPNSSLGNSPAESGGMSPISGEMTDMSPTGIIQAMTSFPIPGGVLISPIHDSLLCLVKKDKLSVSKPMPPLNGRQEHSAILVDELASMMGNRKVLKEKKAKLVAKSERQFEVKHENGTYFEDDMSFQTKKISVNETTGGKEFLPGDLKSMHVSKSESDVRGSLKVAGGGSEVFREGYKDGGKVRLRSSELVKEEASESISGEDCSKNEKGNPSSLVQNVHGNRVLNPHRDVLIDRNDDGNCHKISASLQGYSDGSKCKEDLNPQKEKVGWKTEDDETSVPFKTEGLSLERKNKSKGAQSNGKSVPVSTKESPRFGASADLTNKKNAGYLVADCNSKSQRIKSQKDDKGRDNQRDSLLAPKLEQKDNQMDPVRRSSGDRPKDANLDSFGMQRNAFLDKQKGRISGKKVDGQDISGASIKDASIVRPITETGLTSEIVPPMAAPVLIEEDWVQCDRCQKWRLLPYGTKPEQLPDKWLCSMLNWLHGMNHCNISEEETTKALNALYQLPVSESQNNLQNHVSGTALGVYLGDVQHLDQNHQNVSAQAAANRGKKKHGLKEIANAGSPDGPFQISKSTKNKLQESTKSRSINGKNQRHAELNLMKKSSSQHLSKKGNLVVDKDMLSQKDKPIDGGHQLSAGDVKQIKMKSKREADEYGGGTSKKSKTEDKSYADKHRTSKMDSDRGHISAITALPTKGSGKDMRKYDEYCLSEDTKLDVRDKVLVSVKKLGDQAQVLSDGGSLDMRMCSKKDVSLKKRKLELEDDKNEIATFQNSAHDGSVYEKEGSSESGLRKEKKFRVSKIQVKESNTNDSDDKSHKRGRMSEIFLSGIRDHPSDTMEEVGRNDKEQQLRKHKKKNSSQPTVDVAESLRRDLGSGQISVAATSSSSKVSGSRKTRANIEELKGSPVESVSSSPLRTSNLDKFTGKDDAMHGGLSMMGDFRRYSDGDNTAEINLPGTVIHPESRKFSVLEYRDGDASHKFSGKAKPSSEFGNSHMLNSHVRMVEQNARFLNDLHAPEHGYNEDGVKKNHHDNSVLQKSGKSTTTLSKGKSRSSTSESDRDKMKVSDPVNGYTKKSHRNHSESDPNHRVPVHETTANAKHGFPKNPSTKFVKDEKNHVSSRDPVGQWSSETQMEIKFKQKEYDGLDVKSCAPCSRDVKLAPQLSLIQDFEGENKADPTQIEPRNGKSKLFSLSDGESKLETVSQGCGPVLGRQKGDMFDGCPIDAPGDVSKALKHSGNVNYNGISHSMGHLVPDRQGVRDLNASSPVRVISSSQTATNTLKEAKDLRDTADRLKSSCFGFESNEAYFQAALKFLHGASLLETCSSENGRHGEMNQIQAYGTAAKLCELCALEYETRQEMAAAALAYKCLEVAYMRVVYCKHSSMSRDRHELQATLQVVPQGESPSSSASDVDNLNNQAPVDKGNLSKGTGSHVAGSQVILARNRPNFVRLLDFVLHLELHHCFCWGSN